MNRSNKVTIRAELFKSSIVLSFAILVIFGILFSAILYYSGNSNAHAVIRQRNRAVNYFIEGYFTKIHNAVEFLATNKKIQNAPYLSPDGLDEILSLYKSLEIADQDINYIYSGYKNGFLLINDYIPPEGFDPVVRPWYLAATESNPNISDGLPYQEVKTKEWLVSLSKVLIDDEDEISGVISIDCSIDTVEKLLREPDEKYKSFRSFVVKTDGKIIIHGEESFLGRTVSDVFDSSVKFDKEVGKFSYKLDSLDKLAYYSRIDQIGWIIVTVVDKKEIIRPIILQMFISILIIGLVAVLLGWILSASLSSRFIVPLIELKKRVNVIIGGNGDSANNYKYPDNEIGTIVMDIEQLAESELLNRNLELQSVNKKLEFLSTTDQLTKLLNRHKMTSELEREFNRAERYKRNFTLIMFDIDWFKKINDTYGHPAGDSVLEELSLLTRKTLRSTDIISRWGGEEFLVLCPEIKLDRARALAVKLCSAVENHRVTVGVAITISVGLCEFGREKNLEDLIKKVDEKLYDAKHQGRNTVVY